MHCECRESNDTPSISSVLAQAHHLHERVTGEVLFGVRVITE